MVYESDAWSYLVDVVGPSKRGRGKPKKTPEGIVSRLGIIYDCFACPRELRKKHSDHTRNGEPPLLCRYYQEEPRDWKCEMCLRLRPIIDPRHTLTERCRFEDGGVEVARRTKKQPGLQAGAKPVKDPTIQAAGVADGDPVTDDLHLDEDVEVADGAVSAQSASASGQIVTKEGRNESTPYRYRQIARFDRLSKRI